MRLLKSIMVAAVLASGAIPLHAQQSEYTPTPDEVEKIGRELPQLILHPIYDEPYKCSEHPFSTSMMKPSSMA